MKKTLKMFVVRKYIRASSVAEAIRKERRQAPDDVWIDEDWKRGAMPELASAIGFQVKNKEDKNE